MARRGMNSAPIQPIDLKRIQGQLPLGIPHIPNVFFMSACKTLSDSKNPSTPSLPYHHYHNHKRISALHCQRSARLYTPSQMQTHQQHMCCHTYILSAIFQLAETWLCAGSPVHPSCWPMFLRSHVLQHLCSVSFLHAPFGVVTIFSC